MYGRLITVEGTINDASLFVDGLTILVTLFTCGVWPYDTAESKFTNSVWADDTAESNWMPILTAFCRALNALRYFKAIFGVFLGGLCARFLSQNALMCSVGFFWHHYSP